MGPRHWDCRLPGQAEGSGDHALALRPHTLPLVSQPQECSWQCSGHSCGATTTLASSQPSAALPWLINPVSTQSHCVLPACPQPHAVQGWGMAHMGTPLHEDGIMHGDMATSWQCCSPHFIEQFCEDGSVLTSGCGQFGAVSHGL